MEEKKLARPKKLKLVTIDEALKLIEEHFQYPMYKKGTIYNKISLGVLTNYGKLHRALLNADEVFEKLCSKERALLNADEAFDNLCSKDIGSQKNKLDSK